MINEIAYENREEWLAIRKKYIGGSDAGCVIGTNPYRSAYALWAEKTGRVEGFSGNITTDVGAYLEQFVAELWCKETGKQVRRKNRILVNDEYPFACADIDRLVVGEKAFLEIKTTNSFEVMKQLRNGAEFPDIYYAQCVHYLAVTGFDKCYLAVLVNCREFKTYELLRDENEIRALMDAEQTFAKCISDDVPPEADGSESTTQTISDIYPTSNDLSVDLSPVAEAIRNYTIYSAQEKQVAALKDEAANKIKAYMGEAGKGTWEDYTVTFASYSRKTFDKDALAKEHPEIELGSYMKESTSRRFSLTEKKAKAKEK